MFPIDTAFYVDDNSSFCFLRWLYYLLLTLNLDKLETDNPVPGLGREIAEQKKVPLPTLAEQKAIAEYLDRTCEKIDRIISIKEKPLEKIEEYLGRKIDEIILNGLGDFEKKSTRKDFIGDIPKHYRVNKLKFITEQIVDGTHFTPNYIEKSNENDVPFLRVTDIQDTYINLARVKYIDENGHLELTKRCKPEKGDLLLSKNGTIGITKVVDWNFEFSIFVSICLIKPSKFIDVNYLNYYFKSDIMKYQLSQGSKQITVTNLHLDKIREFYIVTPPIDEQIKLVEKMRTIESKVNLTSEVIESQIKTLKSYRKSLIHECVTGNKQIVETFND